MRPSASEPADREARSPAATDAVTPAGPGPTQAGSARTDPTPTGPTQTDPARRGGATKGDRRREQIVSAAVECLVDDGWPGVTHRRVADRAGANAGLLHYYFGSLSGLRRDVAVRVSAEVLATFGAALHADPAPGDLVDVWSRELADPGPGDRRVRALVQIMVGTAYYPEVATVVRDSLGATRRTLAAYLIRVHPEWTPAQAEARASLLIALLDGVALHALADPAGHPVDGPTGLRSVLGVLLAGGRQG
ncbi:TetR/AcrR family transcriptional regulator [Micromonospora sp. NPDC050187]|uniref:TetR/AcrR family transcriptional regulator n=1 Tax=Micromonospora sp. NPDC050187 TaxID=3364277 RepID=UPI0037B3780C